MKELVDNTKKDAPRQLLLFQLQGSQNRRAKRSSTQGLLQIQISGPDLGQITFGELLVSNLEPIIAELIELRKIFYAPSHSYQLGASV